MKKVVITLFSLIFLVQINYAQKKNLNYSPPLEKGAEKFVNKAKIIRGPYLQVATETSMIVRWRTNLETRSRVSYGLTPNALNKSVDDLEFKTEHEIKLTGLTPNTKYYYGVGALKDTLQKGEDTYFTTLPKVGSEDLYRIGVFGDCGALTINQANVRDQFVKYLGQNDLNAWILLGDNAYNDGTDIEYQAKFFNIYKDKLLKNYPVFPSPGNHDYHDVDFGAEYAQNTHNTAYFKNFSMPTKGEAGGVASGNPAFYSFDVGNIHFISLDSYGIEDKKDFLYKDTLGTQVKWLKKDLELNKNKGWVVAFWHYPPYSKGTHDSDTDDIMTGIRENVINILERNGVDLIITGHSHVYERSKLMAGHYGKSNTFEANKHNLSNSSGLNNGTKDSEPYVKKTKNGTVYVVSGSASYVGEPYPDFPHKAMHYSNATDAGAAILEVKGNHLEFKWICADGEIRDQFTMLKEVDKKEMPKRKK